MEIKFDIFIWFFVLNLGTVYSISVAPVLTSTPFIEAGSKMVMNGELCNCYVSETDPLLTATIPFNISFSSTPQLAFGYTTLQNKDTLFREIFQVNCTNLDSASFEYSLIIGQMTSIWKLQIRYFAVDKLFPHHLNCFHNVPVNITYGPLINISNPNSGIQTVFINQINYTAQAINAGSYHLNFTYPLVENKVILFLTSLYIKQNSGTYRRYLTTQTSILTSQIYRIQVKYARNGQVDRLHFSIIIFNAQDIQQSGIYMVISQTLTVGLESYFYKFPIQSLDYFMVGFYSFASHGHDSIFNITSQFFSNGSDFGFFKLLTQNVTGRNLILAYNLTIFYIKSWICPDGMFLNFTTSACQSCNLTQCLLCLNSSECLKCNVSNNYYLSGGVCQCRNSTNVSCQDNNNFSSTTACLVSNCLNCSSNSTCLSCNIQLGFFINMTDFLCYSCAVSNCLNCLSIDICSVCNQSAYYFLDSNGSQCSKCNLTGCLECKSLTECSVCDTQNQYGFDYTSRNRTLCGPCNVSCICDGYAEPWNEVSQICNSICGDGKVRSPEQCDDNNTNYGDGCSHNCTIQTHYLCDKNQPSRCQKNFQQAILQFKQLKRVNCNYIYIIIKIDSSLEFYKENPQIFIQNHQISIISFSIEVGYMEIKTQIKEDFELSQIIILINNQRIILNLSNDYQIPLLHLTEQECKAAQGSDHYFLFLAISGYITFFIGLFTNKIVGLQLFGVLQLSYFTLAMHDFQALYLAPLLKGTIFNGYNHAFFQESPLQYIRFQRMSVGLSFLNNCNFFLIVSLAIFIIVGIIYLISILKKIKKMKKIAIKILKQGLTTLVLFNIFNVSFSAGIHFKYGFSDRSFYAIENLVISVVLFTVISLIIYMQFGNEKGYGQFKNQFKSGWVCKFYIPLTIIYRFVLGLYISIYNDYSQGSLIVTGLTFPFLLYNIANFPFKKTLHNYRATIIHISMTYILLTTNYYRGMKMNTPLLLKARQTTPAIIQLALISLCVVSSFSVLIYQIYSQIRRRNMIRDNQRDASQDTIGPFNH